MRIMRWAIIRDRSRAMGSDSSRYWHTRKLMRRSWGQERLCGRIGGIGDDIDDDGDDDGGDDDDDGDDDAIITIIKFHNFDQISQL